MRRKSSRVLGAVLVWLILSAESTALEPIGKRIEYPSGDRRIRATLFQPAGKGPFPALVQIPANPGQRPTDLDFSKRLAEAGYVTLSVDLFGRVGRDFGEGLRLRDQAMPTAAADLRAAVAYLRTLKNVSPDRIGAIGASSGGGMTLTLAVAEPTLGAAIIYYGQVSDTEEVEEPALRGIQACVLALYGRESRVTPIAGVRMFANTLRDAGKHVELHIYPDAGHGFADPDNEGYQPALAQDAWNRTLSFLKTHLAEARRSEKTAISNR